MKCLTIVNGIKIRIKNNHKLSYQFDLVWSNINKEIKNNP